MTLADGTPSILLRNNLSSNSVLSNRWTETVDIDRHCYTRRTREGKYVIRSDNELGRVADYFRFSMAQLGIPQGFVRESSRYTVDPSGLAIRYQMVDAEQFKMPPVPAMEADGTYLESTTNNGAVRWGEVEVTLKGAKGTSQPLLIDRAVSIAASKLIINGAVLVGNNQAGNQGGSFAKLERSAIKVDMYNNVVQVAMRSMMQPRSRARFNGVAGYAGFIEALPIEGVGFNPEGIVQVPGQAQIQAFAQQAFGAMTHTPFSGPGDQNPPNYPLRGSAGLLLLAAAYWDPSIPNLQVNPQTGSVAAGNNFNRTDVGTGRFLPGGL